MPKAAKPTPFGRAIRTRLAELDMQQKDLADMLGVSCTTITYTICGQRHNPEMVERICAALDIPVKVEWKEGA